jgi:hypothetical protein
MFVCLVICGGVRGAHRMYKPMGIKLDPQTIEAISRKVVELLDKRGLRRRELVDAAELARRLGIERSWVYSHAIELGAVKLGSGTKPRLRFDPEVAARFLQKVGEGPATDPPPPEGLGGGGAPGRARAGGWFVGVMG